MRGNSNEWGIDGSEMGAKGVRFADPRVISEEATSTLIRCVDTRRGCEVVVKVPKEGCEQTRREVELLPQLSHPNVVSLLESIETSNGPACVYKAAKCDLYGYLGRRLPEWKVKVIARGLLKGVEHMHDRGVVHRDIKPENILVMSEAFEESDIVIADLGLSRLMPEKEIDDEYCGSAHYAAPEIWRGEGYGESVDIWATGVVLYTCLVGGLPMPSGVEEAGEAVLSGLPRLFEGAGASVVSSSARELLRGMLDPTPRRRPTAGEALRSKWLWEGEEECEEEREKEKVKKDEVCATDHVAVA